MAFKQAKHGKGFKTKQTAINVKGTQSFIAALKYLDMQGVKYANRSGINKGLTPMRSEAKKVTPKGPAHDKKKAADKPIKTLRDGLFRRTKTYRTGSVVGKVGNNAPHAHLYEFGTFFRVFNRPHYARIQTDSGSRWVLVTNSGSQEPTDALKNSLDKSGGSAVSRYKTGLKTALAREVQKAKTKRR